MYVCLCCTGFSFVPLSFPFSCKNLIDLRKHLDTHSRDPAYRCEFEGCSFTARSLCSIKLHYRKVHEVGREQRGSSAVYSASEAENLEIQCAVQKHVQCSAPADQGWRKEKSCCIPLSLLQSHGMSVFSQNLLPPSKHMGGYRALWSVSWGIHIPLSAFQGDSEPRYKCHVCDKCFTRGNNLTVHLRKKHQFKWPSGHPRFRYCPSLAPYYLRSSARDSWSCILRLAGADTWLCLASDTSVTCSRLCCEAQQAFSGVWHSNSTALGGSSSSGR